MKRALPLAGAVVVVLGWWCFTSSSPTAREDGATPATKAPAATRTVPRRTSDPGADDVQRIRQTAFSSMYFLFPGVPKEVREKALADRIVRGTNAVHPDAMPTSSNG